MITQETHRVARKIKKLPVQKPLLESRPENDVLDRYALLMAEGKREYRKALSAANIETLFLCMKKLAPDGSSLAHAVHSFDQSNPKLVMKLQSLSSLALIALAQESERYREVLVPDTLADLTAEQQRHFDKAMRFVVPALDAAYLSNDSRVLLFTSEELPGLVDDSRARQDIYGSIHKEMLPVLARLSLVVASRGYQMIRWVNPMQDSAVWRFVAEKQVS